LPKLHSSFLEENVEEKLLLIGTKLNLIFNPIFEAGNFLKYNGTFTAQLSKINSTVPQEHAEK